MTRTESLALGLVAGYVEARSQHHNSGDLPPDFRRSYYSGRRTTAINLIQPHHMHTKIELPKAFSVRDEHEFFPIQHLMARLNPQLTVTRVATGVHVDGGTTVFWGLVYLESDPPSKKKVELALREAGLTSPITF